MERNSGLDHSSAFKENNDNLTDRKSFSVALPLILPVGQILLISSLSLFEDTSTNIWVSGCPHLWTRGISVYSGGHKGPGLSLAMSLTAYTHGTLSKL